MLVLATDIDGTFLGGSLHDRNRLYQLIRSLRDRMLLVFVTGRALENVRPLLADPALPSPDYIIADVGATVVHGDGVQPVEPIDGEIGRRWVGEQHVLEALPPDLVVERQQQTQHRRCSFYTNDPGVVEAVRNAVARLGCDVLHSANRYLDVLPRGVNKGSTLLRLVEHLQLDPRAVLVAGDSLNDLSMFVETPFRGVVVGGSEPALRERTARRPNTVQARQHGAGGILEAIEQLDLLPTSQPGESHSGNSDLIVVYHRQPFDEIERDGGRKRYRPRSPNGIIPTLLGLFRGGHEGAWVAWAHGQPDQFEPRVGLDDEDLSNLVVSRVLLTEADVQLFYQKFSKEALWPILHSFVERAHFDHRLWQHFIDINQRFARQAAAEAAERAFVWIHDYNLWLVPEYLRKARPDVRIAFFHHTPFPSADVFNVIPWCREITSSLLKCDYIGFQIPRYSENFVDTVRSHHGVRVKTRVECDERFRTGRHALSCDTITAEIETDPGGHAVALGAHPVGLDLARIRRSLQSPEMKLAIRSLKKDLAGKKIILSAERLDYMKGPLQKLLAFEQFLSMHPLWREKIIFIDICVPPAQGMTIYDDTLNQVERAVGRINGRFSTPTWTPLTFMFRHAEFEELTAYLALADVAWITPLRDGLNLVAKEYVGVRSEVGKAGALIVSEFAGCSVELDGALLTNPYDFVEMADTLQQALLMDDDEQRDRMARLSHIVRTYDVDHWAREFMRAAGRAPHRLPQRVRSI